MIKSLKKVIIILMLLTSIFSIVSCFQKNNNNAIVKKDLITNFKVNNFSPLDFKLFKNKKFAKNEPIFLNGINYTAYSQGFSFFLNILKGLGWNWEDEDKIQKLYDNNFNFNSIHIEKDSESLFKKNQSILDFETNFLKKFKNDYKKGISQFIEKQGNKLVSNLYNQIKIFFPIHINRDMINSADSSTAVEIQLGSDFSKIDDAEKIKRISQKLNNINIVNKIFQNKKYVYSWSGTILTDLGFQIQDNKIIIWHVSKTLPFIRKNINDIRFKATSFKKWINSDYLKKEKQKNLSQIILDPISADGTMGAKIFYTNLNLKHGEDKSSIEKYLQISEQKSENNLRFTYGHGKYDWSKRPPYNSNNKVAIQNIARYSSFIDGINPGTTILKMYEGQSEPTLNIQYSLETSKTRNRIQTFYEITKLEKKKYFVKLIMSFINFIKFELNNPKKVEEILDFKKYFSPIVNSLFEFIKNNNIDLKNIEKSFNMINNGSHYMLAVEIFFRGMKNIPYELSSNNVYPIGIMILNSSKKLKSPKKEIVGMSNTNSLFSMIFMMYSFSKEFREDNEFHNFNPLLLNYDNSAKFFTHIKHFLENLLSSKKIGTENY